MTVENHLGTDHRRNTRRIADCLRVCFPISLLVITYIIDVFLQTLPVFDAIDHTTNTGLALGQRPQRGGIRKNHFEKLKRRDFFTPNINGLNGCHANIF